MKKNTKKKIITEDIVRYVALLARIELDADDIAMYRTQLSDILEYIGQLNEVETKDINPLTHVLSSMKNVFRDDNPEDSISQEDALKNAPLKEGNFFKVPKVIKDA